MRTELAGVALALLASVACNTNKTPKFALAPVPSCTAHFTSWTGGLTFDILQGPGDGTFSFDPADKITSSLAGSYDLSTGDFSWDAAYDPASYLTSTHAEGYGYANENGDLDVEYTDTTTDTLGVATSTDHRITRTGCTETRYARDDTGAIVSTTLTYQPGEVDATIVSPNDTSVPFTVTSVQKSDLSYESTLDWQNGGDAYSYNQTGDASGNSTRDWTQVSSKASSGDGVKHTYVGTSEYKMTGEEITSYTDNGTATYSYDLDYAGDGTGSYDNGSGITCTLKYKNNACTYSCTDGSKGSC